MTNPSFLRSQGNPFFFWAYVFLLILLFLKSVFLINGVSDYEYELLINEIQL